MPEKYPGGYYSDGQGRDTYIVKDAARLQGTYQRSAYDKNRPRPKEPVPTSLTFGPPVGYQGHVPHANFYHGKTYGQQCIDSAVERGKIPPPAPAQKIDASTLFKGSCYTTGEGPDSRCDEPVSCKVMHPPEPYTHHLSPRSLKNRIINRYQTTNMFEYGEDQEYTKPILPPYLHHIPGYAGHVPRTHVHASYLNMMDSEKPVPAHVDPNQYQSEGEYAEACVRDLFDRLHQQGDDSAFTAYMSDMVSHGPEGDLSGEDLFNVVVQTRAALDDGSQTVSIDGVEWDQENSTLSFKITYAGTKDGEATTLFEDVPCKYRFDAQAGKFVEAW